MKNLLRFIPFSLLFLPLAASAQTFTSTQTCTLAASACVSTLQQPTAPLKSYRILSVTISSTTALSVNVERSGNLATTTAGTNYCLDCPTSTTTSEALTYTASNASAGNVVATYQVAAGAAISTNFNAVFLQPGQIPLVGRQSFTVRTTSATGTVSLVIAWQEFTP